MLRKGQLTVRPGDVALTIHEPIDTAQISKDAVRELAARVHDVIDTKGLDSAFSA